MDVFFEISGENFGVESALEHSPLREFAKIWQRGEPGGVGIKRPLLDSGFSVCIGGSDDDCDLERQIADALDFLREESVEIRRLRALPNVQRASLRFGEWWNTETVAGRFSRLPSELLLECGQLGLGIVLCQYLTTKISKDETHAA